MPLKQTSSSHVSGLNSSLSIGIMCFVISLSLAVGVVSGLSQMLLVLGIVAVIGITVFFADFEHTVVGLLILRSSLDIFSAQKLPAAFAIGIIGLTFLYVLVRLFLGETIHFDWFLGIFFSWVLMQALWLLFMATGDLGLDASFLSDSITEWVRLLLWPSTYLMVIQLKNRLSYRKLISFLFLALITPIGMAALQIVQAPSELRFKGTFGHPNVFASFLLIFIGLTLWQLSHAKERRWLWFSLLAVLVVFLISTKALFVLAMLGIVIAVYIIPRVNVQKLLGGVLLFTVVLGLFASSEFGQMRLESLYGTPILNSEISVERAIVMSEMDHNSFNWRLAHWNMVIGTWQQQPTLGYGLGLSQAATGNSKYLPHNDYLRALIEGGTIGLVTYLGLFFAMITRLLQLMASATASQGKRDFCLIVTAIIIATLGGMITENIWSHTVFFMYLSVLMAIAGFNWNQESEEISTTLLTAQTFKANSPNASNSKSVH